MSETNFERTLLELQNRKDDIRPSDVILFSEPLRSALNFVIRLGRFSLTEFNEKLGFTREQARRVTELLIQRNLIVVSRFSTTEETYYESRLSALTRPLSRPSLDIWKKID
jgi:predicted transcriptional regulator